MWRWYFHSYYVVGISTSPRSRYNLNIVFYILIYDTILYNKQLDGLSHTSSTSAAIILEGHSERRISDAIKKTELYRHSLSKLGYHNISTIIVMYQNGCRVSDTIITAFPHICNRKSRLAGSFSNILYRVLIEAILIAGKIR